MTRNMTLNIMMVVVTMIMKMMNATVNVMIDTVEMVMDMITAIRKKTNTKTIIRLMIVMMVMKMTDMMISGTAAKYVNVMNAITKVVSVRDVVEITEVLIVMITALITYISDVWTNTTKNVGNISVDAAVNGSVMSTGTAMSVMAFAYDGIITKRNERLSNAVHGIFAIPLR